jgi:hypothetical protein
VDGGWRMSETGRESRRACLARLCSMAASRRSIAARRSASFTAGARPAQRLVAAPGGVALAPRSGRHRGTSMSIGSLRVAPSARPARPEAGAPGSQPRPRHGTAHASPWRSRRSACPHPATSSSSARRQCPPSRRADTCDGARYTSVRTDVARPARSGVKGCCEPALRCGSRSG